MDYEYVLLQKNGVKVYNIPPMASNKGHFLDSWKNKISEVNLKVMGKGQRCIIYLNNYDGSLFATCNVPESYEQGVVKCADSSRGYALRLQDPSGKIAWIGTVFPERNDAFDFNECFKDFEKNRDMELNPQKYAAESKPTHDFSLKKGEKLTLNIGSDGSNQNKPKVASGGAGAFKLAPPPGSNSFGLAPPPGSNAFGGQQASNTFNKPSAPVNQQTNSFDSFGGFGNFNVNPTQNQQSNFNAPNSGFSGFQNAPQNQGFGNQGTSQSNNFDLLGGVNFSAQTNTSQPKNQTNNQQSDPFDLM